jgi:hypothetical protein
VRPASTKPFVYNETMKPGASIIETYDKYEDFKDMKELHN